MLEDGHNPVRQTEKAQRSLKEYIMVSGNVRILVNQEEQQQFNQACFIAAAKVNAANLWSISQQDFEDAIMKALIYIWNRKEPITTPTCATVIYQEVLDIVKYQNAQCRDINRTVPLVMAATDESEEYVLPVSDTAYEARVRRLELDSALESILGPEDAAALISFLDYGSKISPKLVAKLRGNHELARLLRNNY